MVLQTLKVLKLQILTSNCGNEPTWVDGTSRIQLMKDVCANNTTQTFRPARIKGLKKVELNIFEALDIKYHKIVLAQDPTSILEGFLHILPVNSKSLMAFNPMLQVGRISIPPWWNIMSWISQAMTGQHIPSPVNLYPRPTWDEGLIKSQLIELKMRVPAPCIQPSFLIEESSKRDKLTGCRWMSLSYKEPCNHPRRSMNLFHHLTLQRHDGIICFFDLSEVRIKWCVCVKHETWQLANKHDPQCSHNRAVSLVYEQLYINNTKVLCIYKYRHYII